TTLDTARTGQRRRYTNRPQAANIGSHPFSELRSKPTWTGRLFFWPPPTALGLGSHDLLHQLVEELGPGSAWPLALCEEIRGEAGRWETAHDAAGLEPVDRAVPREDRVTELDVDLEVAPRARGVRGAPHAQCVSVNVGNEKDVSERVATGGECLPRRIALQCPLELGRLTCPPEGPEVV